MQIGTQSLPFEGIREIKKDTVLDDRLKAELAKDGFDEVIFQQGDQIFIAYHQDLDLSELQVNLEQKSAVGEEGQLSVNGEAVQVLFIDDENKDTLTTLGSWTKSAAESATAFVKTPYGRAASFGFASGALVAVAHRNLNTRFDYHKITPNKQFGQHYKFVPFTSFPDIPGHPRGMMFGPKSLAQFRMDKALTLGAPMGVASVGLKSGFEVQPGLTRPLMGLGAAAGGFIAGGLIGTLGDYAVKQAIQHPKTSLAVAGMALAAVGADLAVSHLTAPEPRKSSQAVIERISVE